MSYLRRPANYRGLFRYLTLERILLYNPHEPLTAFSPSSSLSSSFSVSSSLSVPSSDVSAPSPSAIIPNPLRISRLVLSFKPLDKRFSSQLNSILNPPKSCTLQFGFRELGCEIRDRSESEPEEEGMECGVCSPAEDMWRVMAGEQIGSHESEHDLAAMVSDFLENGSGGTDSWCSSDSDSGFSDLAHLASTISYCRHSTDQYERNLISVVQSLLLSISVADLKSIPSAACNACCIRFSLVKRLRLSGYDAAVCSTKWKGRGKVPGGDHEYIDITHTGRGNSDRFIIDIDFRSHFEIARAVDSYDRILYSLPAVYAGSLVKLEQYLPVMVEAARTSLEQNSMPLPPWRSLAYLKAKWRSPYQRKFTPDEHDLNSPAAASSDHNRCCGHLWRLQSLLKSEIEAELTYNDTRNWGRHSSFKTF